MKPAAQRTHRGIMFRRMLWRSLRVRKSHVALAFMALTIASAAATAMLTLYFGVESKLDKEFRSYGANVVVLGKEGRSISGGELKTAQRVSGDNATMVPVAYAVATLEDGSPIVVAGTDLFQARRLNSWWSVSAFPVAPPRVLIGGRAQRIIGRDDFDLKFADKSFHVSQAGILKTGGPEEDRIYVSLPEFQKWTGLGMATLEIGITGSSRDIKEKIARLQLGLPNLEVRPVRQIVEAEGRVIGKTRSLMLIATIMIAVTVSLCVLASLTASVLERRRDFALMKALGSSPAQINLVFLTEALVLATGATVLGFIAGGTISALIAKVNFHSAVSPELGLFPVVLAGCYAIALGASLLPIARLQEIQPAVILKGD